MHNNLLDDGTRLKLKWAEGWGNTWFFYEEVISRNGEKKYVLYKDKGKD